MKTDVTVDDILSYNPCSGWAIRRKCVVFLGHRESLPVKDVLELENVPAMDKLWVVLREDYFTAEELGALRTQFLKTIPRHHEKEDSNWKTFHRWMIGHTREGGNPAFIAWMAYKELGLPELTEKHLQITKDMLHSRVA